MYIYALSFYCSYITVTYVVETMACANAMLQYRRRISGEPDNGSAASSSRTGSNASANLSYSVNINPSPHSERTTERTSLLAGPIGKCGKYLLKSFYCSLALWPCMSDV